MVPVGMVNSPFDCRPRCGLPRVPSPTQARELKRSVPFRATQRLSSAARQGQSVQSTGIFVERSRAWWQLNPWMPAALVDGKSRRWKARVSKRSHGYAHRLIVTLFGVEDSSPTDCAKPECEPCSAIPDADVFGGGTEDFERSREACQCCEDTAGPLLAREAVANANSTRFAFYLNAQLSARASGRSGRH
jgi:hypothetical protein